MSAERIRIGGACGYWGDAADMATAQLLQKGRVDVIVYDYLAEITMSIMARARAKDPNAGYAPDFVSMVMAPHLNAIAEQGVKVVSNAGGVNPAACAAALREAVKAAGLSLKVAVVTGDDLTDRADDIAAQNPKEMFSGAPFPASDRVASINAYLGAFPIAAALGAGADIVVTGRGVDSASTLGACIHAFGWKKDDWDSLAGGSLAGHIIECGAQATGGNFTDWEALADAIADIGYPIAEISADGTFTCEKPPDTGGAVTVGTVGEQMLYEIGDPYAYMLPDVVCDFSDIELEEIGEDRVRVSGAKGRPAPDQYKVSATWQDGWRAGTVVFYYGENAAERGRAFAGAAVERARARLRQFNAPDYEEVLIEAIGDESQYGDYTQATGSREVAVKIAARHVDQRAAGLLLKEIAGAGLAAPPGLCGFAGSRPKPSPVVRLFSFLLPKSEAPISIEIEGERMDYGVDEGVAFDDKTIARTKPPAPSETSGLVAVPLNKIAWARSGDKGDKANVGVLPRKKDYAPYIAAALTTEEVARRFAHFQKGETERFYMPGTGALNFLLHESLGGGGVASLRNDPQGKGYAQLLLEAPIMIPAAMAKGVS